MASPHATPTHVLDFSDITLRDVARVGGKPVGICGQAPSEYPEFAEWLVNQGIDSISLNPDVAIATTMRIAGSRGQAELRNRPRLVIAVTAEAPAMPGIRGRRTPDSSVW